MSNPNPIGFLPGKSAVNTDLVLLPPYPVRYFGFGHIISLLPVAGTTSAAREELLAPRALTVPSTLFIQVFQARGTCIGLGTTHADATHPTFTQREGCWFIALTPTVGDPTKGAKVSILRIASRAFSTKPRIQSQHS